jgi:dihydropteroate synthase
LKEELARVEPVFEIFEKKKIFSRVTVSVDTYKSVVASVALHAGSRMVNDVTALRGDTKMASVLAKSDCRIVMMYAKERDGRTTRRVKKYDDVMQTVSNFFEERLEFALVHGIGRKRIVLDPGMGAFVSGDGKYSFEILWRLRELTIFGLPLLVGTSRKGFLGGDVGERLGASLGTAAMAYMNGASILRVHDVAESKRCLDALWNTVNT